MCSLPTGCPSQKEWSGVFAFTLGPEGKSSKGFLLWDKWKSHVKHIVHASWGTRMGGCTLMQGAHPSLPPWDGRSSTVLVYSLLPTPQTL